MPGAINKTESMIDRVGRAIAGADAGDFDGEPRRYRRFAAAALLPLMHPTEAMLDAAHRAVSPDDQWAINSRDEFKKAVEAMVAFVLASDA
jgi:hypothetical protein